MSASAGVLGFRFDRLDAERRLAGLAQDWTARGEDRRVRLQLSRAGKLEIGDQTAAAPLAEPLRLGIGDARLDVGDPFLRHKTTRREIHEAAFAQAATLGLDEVVLLNRRGRVADASRNSIFVERAGRLVTPPIAEGALPGVLRASLIAGGRALEGAVALDELRSASRWFLGNSLHGLRRAAFG
jgi:para-aminobenzoate synthetase/4-amino-4-deoxychorismate lyase